MSSLHTFFTFYNDGSQIHSSTLLFKPLNWKISSKYWRLYFLSFPDFLFSESFFRITVLLKWPHEWDTAGGDEEQSNTKWSKEIWTPQMEKEAPRYTATTRERALEGSFSVGPMSQKLVLWGVPLARVWVQTASAAHGMQHVCDRGSPFHTALSVGTVIHTPHSTACHLGWCLDMYSRADYLFRTAMQGLCILVFSALWPSTVYLPSTTLCLFRDHKFKFWHWHV